MDSKVQADIPYVLSCHGFYPHWDEDDRAGKHEWYGRALPNGHALRIFRDSDFDNTYPDSWDSVVCVQLHDDVEGEERILYRWTAMTLGRWIEDVLPRLHFFSC